MEILFIPILILVGYYLLRYLDGDFSVRKSEVIAKGNIVTDYDIVIGKYYVIETTFQSGRVKIKKVII